MVGDDWKGTWNPILEGVLIRPNGGGHLYFKLKPMSEIEDDWEWIGTSFYFHRIYMKIKDIWSEEGLSTIHACGIADSYKWMVARPIFLNVSSFIKCKFLLNVVCFSTH